MQTIKINFVDFWPGFVKNNNHFYNLLSKYYSVEISDNPEILFYSVYNNDHLKYNCIRILYSAENRKHDFSGCDYSLTFDFLDNQNHYRYPLYGLYIDYQYPSGNKSKSLNELLKIQSKEKLLAEWKTKTGFCCMVVSNAESTKRIDFFHSLSKVKKVDSGGKLLNNIGGPIVDKLSFIKNYKFVFAFENSSTPGYTTEKILEPLMVNSIPIYWGNPKIGEDFNVNRFLDYSNFQTEKQLIDRILEIESDPNLAVQILSEPIFPNNRIPIYIDEANVYHFLSKIIENRGKIRPVAQSKKKILHYFKIKFFGLNNKILGLKYYIRKIVGDIKVRILILMKSKL